METYTDEKGEHKPVLIPCCNQHVCHACASDLSDCPTCRKLKHEWMPKGGVEALKPDLLRIRILPDRDNSSSSSSSSKRARSSDFKNMSKAELEKKSEELEKAQKRTKKLITKIDIEETLEPELKALEEEKAVKMAKVAKLDDSIQRSMAEIEREERNIAQAQKTIKREEKKIKREGGKKEKIDVTVIDLDVKIAAVKAEIHFKRTGHRPRVR